MLTNSSGVFQTADIRLAAILISLGINTRHNDPVTCVISKTADGRDNKSYTFWFEIVAGGDEERKLMTAVTTYEKSKDWTDFSLDPENPIYWMKGVLDNREVLLNWIRKDVPPMRIITHGSKTILIGERTSKKTRDYFKSLLRNS